MIFSPVKLNLTVNPGLHVANHTLDLTNPGLHVANHTLDLTNPGLHAANHTLHLILIPRLT